jgi:hypothetical protein
LNSAAARRGNFQIVKKGGISMNKMHSIVPAGIIVAVFAAGSWAFDLSAGVRGGLGIANFKGGGVDVTGVVPFDNKSLLGVTGGLALNANFSDIIGAEIDILYCQKGSKAEGSNSETYYDFISGTSGIVETKAERKYTLTYVDVPVLVKFLVPLEAPVKPAFFMGPSFNLMLKSERSEHIDSTYYDSLHVFDRQVVLDSIEDRKGSTKPLQIGLTVGASAETALGPGAVVFDIRYSFGLADIYKKDSNLASLLNSHLVIMAGYNYRF